jgi:RNA polymerase-binding protein DksA
MTDPAYQELRQKLLDRKEQLHHRIERITANLRRGFESDSKEMAKQLEDCEVVDALGNDARAELNKISTTLERLDSGDYGLCVECEMPIARERLEAYPYAGECIDCATMGERFKSRN